MHAFPKKSAESHSLPFPSPPPLYPCTFSPAPCTVFCTAPVTRPPYTPEESSAYGCTTSPSPHSLSSLFHSPHRVDGTWSSQRINAPVDLCAPVIPHDKEGNTTEPFILDSSPSWWSGSEAFLHRNSVSGLSSAHPSLSFLQSNHFNENSTAIMHSHSNNTNNRSIDGVREVERLWKRSQGHPSRNVNESGYRHSNRIPTAAPPTRLSLPLPIEHHHGGSVASSRFSFTGTVPGDGGSAMRSTFLHLPSQGSLRNTHLGHFHMVDAGLYARNYECRVAQVEDHILQALLHLAFSSSLQTPPVGEERRKEIEKEGSLKTAPQALKMDFRAKEPTCPSGPDPHAQVSYKKEVVYAFLQQHLPEWVTQLGRSLDTLEGLTKEVNSLEVLRYHLQEYFFSPSPSSLPCKDSNSHKGPGKTGMTSRHMGAQGEDVGEKKSFTLAEERVRQFLLQELLLRSTEVASPSHLKTTTSSKVSPPFFWASFMHTPAPSFGVVPFPLPNPSMPSTLDIQSPPPPSSVSPSIPPVFPIHANAAMEKNDSLSYKVKSFKRSRSQETVKKEGLKRFIINSEATGNEMRRRGRKENEEEDSREDLPNALFTVISSVPWFGLVKLYLILLQQLQCLWSVVLEQQQQWVSHSVVPSSSRSAFPPSAREAGIPRERSEMGENSLSPPPPNHTTSRAGTHSSHTQKKKTALSSLFSPSVHFSRCSTSPLLSSPLQEVQDPILQRLSCLLGRAASQLQWYQQRLVVQHQRLIEGVQEQHRARQHFHNLVEKEPHTESAAVAGTPSTTCSSLSCGNRCPAWHTAVIPLPFSSILLRHLLHQIEPTAFRYHFSRFSEWENICTNIMEVGAKTQEENPRQMHPGKKGFTSSFLLQHKGNGAFVSDSNHHRHMHTEKQVAKSKERHSSARRNTPPTTRVGEASAAPFPLSSTFPSCAARDNNHALLFAAVDFGFDPSFYPLPSQVLSPSELAPFSSSFVEPGGNLRRRTTISPTTRKVKRRKTSSLSQDKRSPPCRFHDNALTSGTLCTSKKKHPSENRETCHRAWLGVGRLSSLVDWLSGRGGPPPCRTPEGFFLSRDSQNVKGKSHRRSSTRKRKRERVKNNSSSRHTSTACRRKRSASSASLEEREEENQLDERHEEVSPCNQKEQGPNRRSTSHHATTHTTSTSPPSTFQHCNRNSSLFSSSSHSSERRSCLPCSAVSSIFRSIAAPVGNTQRSSSFQSATSPRYGLSPHLHSTVLVSSAPVGATVEEGNVEEDWERKRLAFRPLSLEEEKDKRDTLREDRRSEGNAITPFISSPDAHIPASAEPSSFIRTSPDTLCGAVLGTPRERTSSPSLVVCNSTTANDTALRVKEIQEEAEGEKGMEHLFPLGCQQEPSSMNKIVHGSVCKKSHNNLVHSHHEEEQEEKTLFALSPEKNHLGDLGIVEEAASLKEGKSKTNQYRKTSTEKSEANISEEAIPREYSLRAGFPIWKAIPAFLKAVTARAIDFSDEEEAHED